MFQIITASVSRSLRWQSQIRALLLTGLLSLLVACGPTVQDGVRLYSEEKFSEALPILQIHAAREDAVASYFLAQMHERGDGVKAEPEKAANLYATAAKRGLPHGIATVAALQIAASNRNNIPELLQTLERIATHDPEAALLRWCEVLHNLASAAEDGAYQADFLSCTDRLLASDDASALRLLAAGYISGAAGAKDFAKSASNAEQAAGKGDIRAHALLAAAYAEGLGKPQDFVRAYAYAHTALVLGGAVMSEGRKKEMDRLQTRAFRNLSQNSQAEAEALAGRLKENSQRLMRVWDQQHRFAWALKTTAVAPG